MDRRTALPPGTILPFPGFPCEIGVEIGRGSNALVYEGSYRDAADQTRVHRVLVKELFPLETDGRIRRMEAAGMHKRRMPMVLDPFGREGADR